MLVSKLKPSETKIQFIVFFEWYHIICYKTNDKSVNPIFKSWTIINQYLF